MMWCDLRRGAGIKRNFFDLGKKIFSKNRKRWGVVEKNSKKGKGTWQASSA
jgi:hypothetical protein